MTHAIFGDLHAPIEPQLEEPPIKLSPEAPHRLRRAEDTEELRIREEIWQHFNLAVSCSAEQDARGRLLFESIRPALMAALDEYRRELGILALRRLGMGGTR